MNFFFKHPQIASILNCEIHNPETNCVALREVPRFTQKNICTFFFKFSYKALVCDIKMQAAKHNEDSRLLKPLPQCQYFF